MVIEFMQASPRVSIILISVLISLFMVLVYKYTTNQSKMKEIKELQKKYQKEMKTLKNDPKKMMEVQKKVMNISMEMLRHSFVPMIITMLPLFVLIIWLRNIYSGTEIAKTWIWYYLVFGIVSNSSLRKVFKVY